MKKIKNKFIIIIIFVILIIIFLQLIISFFINKADRNSYVVLLEWRWTMNKILLEKDERKVIQKEVVIQSIWKNSIVIIEWWDWSITRLWWDTSIVVKESDINNNLSKINISFNLLSWKTWSNVISFFWKDSYFNQSFSDLEAWVRWTVFNVDLDKGYLNVINHEVLLKSKSWENYLITKGNPFSLKTLSFIDIKDFTQKISDKVWEKYNNTVDKEYLKSLYEKYDKEMKLSFIDSMKKNNPITFFSRKHIILKKIENWVSIDYLKKVSKTLSKKEKRFLYEKILYKYQNIHFISSEDKSLFKKKVYYKRVLLILADNENKKYLLNSSLIDFKEVLNSYKLLPNISNKELFRDVFNILDENKDLLNNIDEDLKKIFIDLPADLNNFMLDKFNSFKNSFWINDLSIDSINNIKQKAEDKIIENLNVIINK